VIGRDRDDLSQCSRGQELADLCDVGEKSRPHRLHEEESIGPSRGDQLFGLPGIHRERLFHEHSLPCAQGEQRPGVMQRMRSCDVHGVDVRVGHQRVVACMPVRDVESICEAIRRIHLAGPDRGDTARVSQSQVGCEGLGDSARSDQAPIQWFNHRFHPFADGGARGRTLRARAPREPDGAEE
jgi:hypothetical protein